MRLYPVLAAGLSLLAIVINIRLYTTLSEQTDAPTDEEIIAQLRFLDDAISEGAAQDMQAVFPEGFCFLHVLYGLSWVEVARNPKNPALLQREALHNARQSLRQIESPEGYRPFTNSLNPPYGAFYAGWRTWLHGAILAAQNSEDRDTTDVKVFNAECTAIAHAFDNSNTPFLQSYPGYAWPADACVAAAALQLHDHLFTPRFTETIHRWMTMVKSRLDPATGMIPHSVYAETGYPVEGARGSSQSLMLRFLIDIDSTFARAQYTRYRDLFTTTWIGLPGIREYPQGTEGSGDVDSGPVAFGIGASATIVGIGTARMFGDHEFASQLNGTVEALGMPIEWGDHKHYLLGQMPIGDAFLVWSRLAHPFSTEQSVPSSTPQLSQWWRLPFHLLTAGILILIWLPARKRRRR